LKVSTEDIKELREKSGAGVMECRNALVTAEGQIEKALEILRTQNMVKVEKKKARTAAQGLIECYVHAGGHIAAMIEINCETDFVARTDQFKELAHNVAMQVAAMEPECVSQDQLPADSEADPKVACLMLQPYIRDQAITIQDLVNQAIAKLGENIKVGRFARFEVGD
jgi:elongation factor Ts